MGKYERLYTADEVDGMIARAKAAAAQPATVAQLCEVAFSVKREAIEICKQQGHLEAAHAIQGLLAVNAHVDPATPPAAAQRKPLTVDCIGLALDLETQSKRVESQTVERAMIAAANGLRIIEADHGIKENT